jgi:hypothetical protein
MGLQTLPRITYTRIGGGGEHLRFLCGHDRVSNLYFTGNTVTVDGCIDIVPARIVNHR